MLTAESVKLSSDFSDSCKVQLLFFTHTRHLFYLGCMLSRSGVARVASLEDGAKLGVTWGGG